MLMNTVCTTEHTEVHHLVADAAEVHDRAGHDEEGDGQHGEGLGGVHDLLEDGPGLDAGVDEQKVKEGGAEEGVHNGHAHEIEDKDQEDGDQINKGQFHQ